MYSPGNILYFTPFYFSNGNTAKNKYFIVLSVIEDEIIVASLPTSKDHVPNFLTKKHGCINDEQSGFNCYYFEKHRIISECNTFSFPFDTYVYGEQAGIMSKTALDIIYSVEENDYIKLGKLSNTEFTALKNCLVNSSAVKRKIKKYLKIN
ncbi:MAG: hypothetical protein LBK94_08770 [Prevotellaceae bacterium]|jgi:hypothetical protein|nr:hypothetical protein [Prevotellaceae bacterium]